MLTFYVHADQNQPTHYTHYPFENNLAIRAVITSSLKPNATHTKYFIQLKTINQLHVSGKLLLYVPKTNRTPLVAGTELYVCVPLHPIPNAFNPYQFDYSNYMEKQNVFHQIYATAAPIKIIHIHHNLDYYLEALRNHLRTSFAPHHFDSKTQALLDALLLGQREALDKETIADYSNAGVIHILAISGLHISILYFLLIFLLKPLKKVRFGKPLELLLLLAILWLFALITGLPASVTRAVTLFSFMSIGRYFNQSKATFNALALAALLQLLFKPTAVFDVGFQLSYAAVLAIIILHPFYKKGYFSKHKIAVYFTDIILVSVSAQVGVLPLSLYYFNQMPLLFLAANLVIIPMATLLLISGIITMLLNFLMPVLALYLGKWIALLVECMNRYIHWMAQSKAGLIENISFSVGLTLMLYLVLISSMYWLYHFQAKHFKWVLASIFLFQITYLGIKWDKNKSDALVVFNTKTSAIAVKKKNKIRGYTDSIELNRETLNDYKRGTFSDSLHLFAMQNIFSVHHQRILVVDQFGIYKTSVKPDVLILIQNPKINLARVLQEIRPKQVVADKSNYKNNTKRWEITCKKENIPFHAVAEKGCYTLE